MDHTFRENASGLGGTPSHLAYNTKLPGRVDLWELEPLPEKDDDPLWHDPVDRIAPNRPAVKLANRIAGKIAEIIGKVSIPGENGRFRPISAGDILILVQGRGAGQ